MDFMTSNGGFKIHDVARKIRHIWLHKTMSWKQTKLINPKTKIANLDISKGEYYKKQYPVIQFT